MELKNNTKLVTFAKGSLVGIATGFFSGFSMFWFASPDYPFWAALCGLPIGGLSFLFLPEKVVSYFLVTLWVIISAGIFIGLILVTFH